MLLNIFITILFVFANAFCVAAEFAIVKVRMSQLRIKAKEGSKLAALSQNIVTHLDSYLSATQLGITLASLGLGWIGEPVVGEIILIAIDYLNLNITPETAHSLSLPIAFSVITILHIVLGELVPKSLAILYPENVTMTLSIPLKILHTIFRPFIFILNGTANALIRLVGLQPPTENDEYHSTEELRMILADSSKSGELENEKHKLLDNIFDFSDTPVKQIMVPRNKIIALEKDTEITEIWETIIEYGYSRIPIYDQDIDNIIGMVYGKDLLTLIKNRNLIILEDIIRKPLFIDENEYISKVLKKMQTSHLHFGIVYNEFAGTAGLVTLEDIIEEIVGEIQDEHDDDAETFVKAVSNEDFDVIASLAISDVNDFLPVEIPESEDYETVGGYILSLTSSIPKEQEQIVTDDYVFLITGASSRKIEKVRISYRPKEQDNTDEDEEENS